MEIEGSRSLQFATCREEMKEIPARDAFELRGLLSAPDEDAKGARPYTQQTQQGWFVWQEEC
jgi:hypothetical protein